MPEPRTYQWRVLQTGSLPLRPDGSIQRVEHACTSVLIWPTGEAPTRANTIVTDPCFTTRGFAAASAALGELGLTIEDIGRAFITHEHGDHLPFVPRMVTNWRYDRFEPHEESLRAAACPGHHPGLRALTFVSGTDRVWIVGDAVLDEEWLRRWGHYWPNGYSSAEIAQTWRSVARIVGEADVVLPGHGPALRVTTELVDALIDRFDLAEHSGTCPDVVDALCARRARDRHAP